MELLFKFGFVSGELWKGEKMPYPVCGGGECNILFLWGGKKKVMTCITTKQSQ